MSASMKTAAAGLKTACEPLLRDDPEKAARIIGHLFSRFADLYAVRWTESGNDRTAWTRELGNFDLAAIAYAVAQAEKRYLDWPPVLAVFKSLCREYVPTMDERLALERKLYADAPKDTEIARRHKGYIRARLEMPNGDEAGLREFLVSPEHKRNVLRMRRR